MVDATPAACSRLSTMLDGYADDIAVRVSIRNRRLKTRADKLQPGDSVIEHQGRAVLLMDKSASRRLRNRTLDVRKTENGPKLRFRPKKG